MLLINITNCVLSILLSGWVGAVAGNVEVLSRESSHRPSGKAIAVFFCKVVEAFITSSCLLACMETPCQKEAQLHPCLYLFAVTTTSFLAFPKKPVSFNIYPHTYWRRSSTLVTFRIGFLISISITSWKKSPSSFSYQNLAILYAISSRFCSCFSYRVINSSRESVHSWGVTEI